MTTLTWVDIYKQQTDCSPDARYARCGDHELTYGQLRERVDALAASLLRDGVRPGQVVAVWMTNSLEFLIAQWATYRAGCTLLPLYSYYREVELHHALNESRATMLITSADFAGKVDVEQELRSLLPELADQERSSFENAPELRSVISAKGLELPGVVPLTDLLERGPEAAPVDLDSVQERLASTDLMNIMYTSGTTGTPKAGLSMHANNLATVTEWTKLAGLNTDSVILTHVPMFTNFGCLYTNALAMYAGCAMEITQTFDAAESLRLIAERHVTYIPGTPEMFRMLLDHADFAQCDVSSVSAAHVAGSQLDEALMRRIIDQLAPNAMQAYGMSECGGLSTATSADDPIDKRLTSIGRPLPSAMVRIVDPDSKADRDVGEVGEIWFGDRSPGSCVGKGYLFSPDATAESITPDGWFRSGDLGRQDDDGYLYFAGRRKQMLTVGGFNVYPAEIEQHIAAMPGVASCYVVGVDDSRLGTVPAAFVIPEQSNALSADDIITFMRERVSSQKQPRHVWMTPLEDLPRTPAGKVQLADLTDLAATRADRSSAASE